MTHFEDLDRMKGFSSFAGVEVLSSGGGLAEGRIKIKEQHMNPINTVHGGVMFTLADHIAGVACASTGALGTTMRSSIEYLNPAFGPEEIVAKAKPVKLGKSICIYDVDITDEKGTMIARASFSYFVLERRDDIKE